MKLEYVLECQPGLANGTNETVAGLPIIASIVQASFATSPVSIS
jgi:hypothetical protein